MKKQISLSYFVFFFLLISIESINENKKGVEDDLSYEMFKENFIQNNNNDLLSFNLYDNKNNTNESLKPDEKKNNDANFLNNEKPLTYVLHDENIKLQNETPTKFCCIEGEKSIDDSENFDVINDIKYRVEKINKFIPIYFPVPVKQEVIIKDIIKIPVPQRILVPEAVPYGVKIPIYSNASNSHKSAEHIPVYHHFAIGANKNDLKMLKRQIDNFKLNKLKGNYKLSINKKISFDKEENNDENLAEIAKISNLNSFNKHLLRKSVLSKIGYNDLVKEDKRRLINNDLSLNLNTNSNINGKAYKIIDNPLLKRKRRFNFVENFIEKNEKKKLIKKLGVKQSLIN